MKRFIVIINILILLTLACSSPFNTGQDDGDSQDAQPPAAASEKRCGDNVCDGPENPENCPQDCPTGIQNVPSSGTDPQGAPPTNGDQSSQVEIEEHEDGEALIEDAESGYRYVSFSGAISTSLNTDAMGDFTGTAFEYTGDYKVELWFPIEGGEAVQQRNTIVLTEFRDLYFGDTSCTPCEWTLDDNAFEPVSFELDASLNLEGLMENDQPADELVYQLPKLPTATIGGTVICPCPQSASDEFSDPAAYPQLLAWFLQKLVDPIHLNSLETSTTEKFPISPMGYVDIPQQSLSYVIVPDLDTP